MNILNKLKNRKQLFEYIEYQLGIKLDKWIKESIISEQKKPSIYVSPRITGKTTQIAMDSIISSLVTHNTNTVIVSRYKNQSNTMYQTVRDILKKTNIDKTVESAFDNNNIRFVNGSTIKFIIINGSADTDVNFCGLRLDNAYINEYSCFDTKTLFSIINYSHMCSLESKINKRRLIINGTRKPVDLNLLLLIEQKVITGEYEYINVDPFKTYIGDSFVNDFENTLSKEQLMCEGYNKTNLESYYDLDIKRK